MIKVVCYTTSTGRVTRVLTAPDLECLAANIDETESYLQDQSLEAGLLPISYVEDGVIKQDITPEAKIAEDNLITIRGLRNSLLDQSDWTQMGDLGFSDEERASWSTYRQALRDMMSGLVIKDIKDVVFPTKS